MRFARLYAKIFLAFIGALALAELLIFGVYVYVMHDYVSDPVRNILESRAELMKDYVRTNLASREGARDEGEDMQTLVAQLSEWMRMAVWIESADGKLLAASFDSAPPFAPERMTRLRNLAYASDGRNSYFEIPVELSSGRSILLKFYGAQEYMGRLDIILALGLGGVGLSFLLLSYPLSRLLGQPIMELRRTALLYAGGDLSRRTELERRGDEIGELGGAFNYMAERIERLVGGMRELTAHVSHELRSPLARIRIAEELLRENLERSEAEIARVERSGQLSEAEDAFCNDARRQVRNHLDNIRVEIAELDGLIAQILQLSRLDLEPEMRRPRRLDLAELTAEILERFGPAAERREVRFVNRAGPGLFIRGDRDSLRSAISNLVDNAVKFTPPGGALRVEAGPGGASVAVLSFENDTEQPPLADPGQLFDPFRRGEGEGAGAGLGLAIARKVFAAHGGAVEASMGPGVFAVFVSLPLAQPLEAGASESANGNTGEEQRARDGAQRIGAVGRMR